MKKFFVIVLILLAGLSSYPQKQKLSQGQIFETIFSENNLNHFPNQNLIYPGDTLRYLLNGVLPVSFVVKQGESQWKILSNFSYSETDMSMAYLTKDIWKLQSIEIIPSNEKTSGEKPEISTIGILITSIVSGFVLFWLAVVVLMCLVFNPGDYPSIYEK